MAQTNRSLIKLVLVLSCVGRQHFFRDFELSLGDPCVAKGKHEKKDPCTHSGVVEDDME